MQADLEFEYPQKLEKMTIKGDILKWIDEEEQKLTVKIPDHLLMQNMVIEVTGEGK